MLRIGIVTFWQTKDNYGQLLQAYALQYVLREMGHNPFIIRYTHSQVIPFISINKRIKNCVKHLMKLDFVNAFAPPQANQKYMFPVSENDKKREIEMFKSEKLFYSERIYRNFHALKACPPEVDALIAGSDQIWVKLPNNPENGVFYLNFGKKDVKRISYAASFARSEYPNDIKNNLRRYLLKFNNISVREKSGVNICADIGIDAKLVLDPTLLLNGQLYKTIFHLVELKKKELYIYSINIKHPDEIQWTKIKEYAISHGLEVNVTPSSGYVEAKELFDSPAKYSYATVNEWLQYIYSAKCVITPSFHGIVFCLLFHVPFLYIPLKGTNTNGNSRILDLLSDLHIDGHILYDNDDIAEEINKDINWNEVDKILENRRNYSMEFLCSSLNEKLF